MLPASSLLKTFFFQSRGFLFGLPMAMKMNKPFVLVRKPNKLPREVYKQTFDLEYGTSTVELNIFARLTSKV